MFGGIYQNMAGETEPAARSVLIESPTGSGKTVMGFLNCKVMQGHHDDLCIGWVAMRRNLLSQAARENAKLGINVKDVHYVSMFDRYPEALIKARKQGRKILLVVDEAQHDAADSMAHLHNVIEPDYILGLTATPFRTDRVKLCFDKVVKDAGIHQLIQDGWLSRFHHYSIPKWDAETVLEHYCREPETWGKSIFYFLTLEQCSQFYFGLQQRSDEIIARLKVKRPDLNLTKGLVNLVDGDSSKAGLQRREDSLEAFGNGDIACLVNCMVLTEGFDEPTLETAWVRDSVRGPTMQMSGRAFRMHTEWKEKQDARFKYKRIVQSKETHWPMLKTAMADQQFLWQSDEWRSLTVNPKLNLINANARIAIANTVVELPKYLVNKQIKRRRRNTGL
jgi:superfamily II DNA or RNA helicase